MVKNTKSEAAAAVAAKQLVDLEELFKEFSISTDTPMPDVLKVVKQIFVPTARKSSSVTTYSVIRMVMPIMLSNIKRSQRAGDKDKMKIVVASKKILASLKPTVRNSILSGTANQSSLISVMVSYCGDKLETLISPMVDAVTKCMDRYEKKNLAPAAVKSKIDSKFKKKFSAMATTLVDEFSWLSEVVQYAPVVVAAVTESDLSSDDDDDDDDDDEMEVEKPEKKAPAPSSESEDEDEDDELKPKAVEDEDEDASETESEVEDGQEDSDSGSDSDGISEDSE